MGKRKIFVKTDLSIPMVKHEVDSDGNPWIEVGNMPPITTIVKFPKTVFNNKNFDFKPWYEVGIDQITYVCQQQIERFLAKQDAEIETQTIINYCDCGLKTFLNFSTLQSRALKRSITLFDIDRDYIDGYLAYLRNQQLSSTSQKTHYQTAKSVLLALGKRGIISLINIGNEATFPRNPFPGNDRKSKGETPITRAQRKAFTNALKTAVSPLFLEGAIPTVELLSYALFVIALHTGRNTAPLLEMQLDCLRAHPKDNMTFLVLYKRRGQKYNKVTLSVDLKSSQITESTLSIRRTVTQLILRVLELTADLRIAAPEKLKNRVWLCRTKHGGPGTEKDQIIALSSGLLGVNIQKLINDYQLTDNDGLPLRINVSRLRKTFVNRINEITDGDLLTTAMAAGNTPRVAELSYLRPGEDAQKNWSFMGTTLFKELLTQTLGMTEKTPAGQCSDPVNGQYAPRQVGATCMNFLNCLRCRNYVVTGDDLYRLFSFYWRILRERAKLTKTIWDRRFAHIIRLIDRDVIIPGLAKGAFKEKQVSDARERAFHDPHPYWRDDSVIDSLGNMS